jgi:hypothetical protein
MVRGFTIWLRRFCWAIAGITAVAIVIRAAFVASRVPDGWEILRERLVAGLPPVFADKQSSENRVWFHAKERLLDEADRVEKNSNATADECMGIAWALSGAMGARASPNPAIVGRLIWGCPPKNPLVDEWHEIDRTLQARAQQLAAKATSLQPDRADWWRLRALLMVWVEGYARIDADGLQDGLKHDPDNSLYEYLLAVDKMKRAISEMQTVEGPVHYIADQALFESGRQQYERAAGKKTVLCGEQAWHALADFISKVDVPLAVKLMWSNPAGFELATEELAQRIDSPFDESLMNDLSPIEAAELTSWQTKNSTWLKQIAIAPETLWLKDSHATSSFLGRQNRWGFIQRLVSLVRPEDRRAELANLISIAGIAAGAMAVMFLALALVGGVCAALNRKASPPSRPMSLWLPAILFAVLLALTYGFLGMVGAYQPELREFPWPIGIGLAVIFGGIGWTYFLFIRFVWRQSRLKRNERSRVYQFARIAAVICTAIPFLIVQFCVTDARFREVALNTLLKFPTSISSQTKIDYAAAEALGANWHTVDFAALEWCVRHGAFWAVGVTFLCLWRIGWRRTKAEEQPRIRFAASLRFTVKPTLWLAFLLFLASLAITAWWTNDLEHRYQRELPRLNDHAWLVKLADAQLKGLDINAPQ